MRLSQSPAKKLGPSVALTEAHHDLALQLKPQRLLHEQQWSTVSSTKITANKNKVLSYHKRNDYHKEREASLRSKRQPEKSFKSKYEISPLYPRRC